MSGHTLAARLAMAVGMDDLTGGDTAIVKAVEAMRAELDASAKALDGAPGVVRLHELSFRCGDAARYIGVLTAERDEARRDAVRFATSLNAERDVGSPAADGRAVQAALDALGVPLADFGPVVRAVYLAGLQGFTARGGE